MLPSKERTIFHFFEGFTGSSLLESVRGFLFTCLRNLKIVCMVPYEWLLTNCFIRNLDLGSREVVEILCTVLNCVRAQYVFKYLLLRRIRRTHIAKIKSCDTLQTATDRQLNSKIMRKLSDSVISVCTGKPFFWLVTATD